MAILQHVAPVTIASAFLFGMVLALLGSIKLALSKRLTLSEDQVGGLLSALYLALIPMMLISGVLVDALGVRGVILVGGLVTAAGMSLLAVSTSYWAALGTLLLTGAGGACLSTGSSVLMPKAFFPENLAASANMGNVFFGLGALVTPALAELLVRGLGFRRALTLLAGLGLVPAVLAAFTDSQMFPVPVVDRGSFLVVLSDPILWLTGIVFWLYGPLEGSLGTWATTYLTELGFREARAALLLSGFWLTFLASRLATAVLQQQDILHHNSEPWLIAFLALAAAVFLGNMAGAHTRFSGWLGLLAVGVCFGPIFPTLVGILFDHFPEQQRGTAFGAMFAVGASGGLILPPLIGAYARRKSVRQAMRLPMVLALVLAIVTLVLGLSIPLFKK